MLNCAREKLLQFRDRCDGMAAVEMAFVFPIMILLYFGLVDITNFLSANRRVTIAASTVADLVTQMPTTLDKGDLNGFYKAVQPIMKPFPTTTVGIQVSRYYLDNGTVKRDWRHESGPSCGAAASPTESAKFKNLMTSGNDIILTRVCVTMEPIVGGVLKMDEYTLSEQFALRPRQSQTLICSDCQKG